ncbi:MAG: aminotransferase class III-fold pyridoxal phosphate-dependent enzyme [Pelobacteraceae bacterium]
MNSEQEQKYRDTLAKASVRIKELMAQVNELKGAGTIAVVGIGCRFPGGADSPGAFWKLLEEGVDTVSEIPADRWNGADWYDPDPSSPGKSYTKRGAFLTLDELKQFDASFFGISPPEAASLDPQQRLLLETAWESIERSGADPKTVRGSRTGVFVGICGSDYAQGGLVSGDTTGINPYSITGVGPSIASGRISYLLDLHGPNIALDTACSSSLVAVLLAMKSLLSRDCDAALAGGVSLMLTPGMFVALSRMNALSSDGVCRAFGEHANGFVRGEGCGILYLKRLEDAEQSGDPVIAVLRGGAMSHDGQSNGLTAPNALSQQEVIRNALSRAGMIPDEIDAIESHGTGTPLGDPIEARSLAAVFGAKSELPVGSVKTNIGHLEVAAGVAGAIKAIMMVNRNMLLPSLHAEQLNSHIPWDSIPVRVMRELRPFPDTGRPRAVGVSSFGFSGTNAHLIVQEYRRNDGVVFPLSSRTPRTFQRKPYWIDPMALYEGRGKAHSLPGHPVEGEEKAAVDASSILSAIVRMVTAVSGLEAAELDPDVNLFELGLDSLMLIQLRDTMNRDYGVSLELSNLMDDANTLSRLAAFVASRVAASPLPAVRATPPATLPVLSGTGDATVEQFFTTQLEQIRGMMEQQLDALRQGGGLPPAERRKINLRSTILDDESGRLSGQQRAFVTALVASHAARTHGSKQLAQRHRGYQSDWINSLAFRGCLKELVYPIASASSSGARFTDIDGNDYLDLAMGFGVSFFGHAPSFVNEAILERLGRGMELATQIPEAGETAELFCRLTGMERVTFCNTGSDAVMMALRIARTVTGRDRIVLFAGSYHGTTDGVLAFADDGGRVFPTTPGVTFGAVSSVTVLPYGTDEALAAIRAQAGELAAILVEPVQSRRPGFQPVEFLKELRAIADQSGAALIFDEMITGFRAHQGGAQAVFGIKADLATYGKAVGGGMPISMVAGSARFMDAVDGGFWQFGDDSRPETEVTFFGGTFCRHPLAIASSLAALRHMEQEGPALQERVNLRTGRLAQELNSFFVRERVPMLVQHFGSLFRFESYGQYALLLQPLEMDLFFYLLMSRGIYTWERRICFFSTAHTDEDVDLIIAAVQESIRELREGGFPFEGVPPEQLLLPPPDLPPLGGGVRPVLAAGGEVSSLPQRGRVGEGEVVPMSSAQRRIYILCQYEEGEGPYHLSGATLVEGPLDLDKLKAAFTRLVERHESLRTGFDMLDGELMQTVLNDAPLAITRLELPAEEVREAIARFISPFDLTRPPLLRILTVKTGPDRHIIVLDSHHIALDGFSLNILISEFMRLYSGEQLSWPAPQYRDYVRMQQTYLESSAAGVDEQFWLDRLAGQLPVLQLPNDFSRPDWYQFAGDNVRAAYDRELTSALKQAAAKSGTTLFMFLLAGFAALLQRLTSQDEMVVGVAVSSRDAATLNTIGMFANTLPLRIAMDTTAGFDTFARTLTRETFTAFEHQQYPFERIVERLNLPVDTGRNPLFDACFSFENADERGMKIENLTAGHYDLPRSVSMFDLSLEVIEEQGTLRVIFEFPTALFRRESVVRWEESFRAILQEVEKNPALPVGAIETPVPGSRKRPVPAPDPAPARPAASRPTASDLQAYLAAHLPAHMIPSTFHSLERIPLTPNGKVDRNALLSTVTAGLAPAASGADMPRTERERQIAAIWQEVLDLPVVGIHDSFFSIGGHSLKAVRAVARIQKELGIGIRLKDLFAHPTVAGLAALAEQTSRAVAEAIPRVADASGHQLSHAQKRLWLLDQTGKGAASYNMSGSWLIDGPLDIDALHKSFEQTVARHEAFRTSFVQREGVPSQVIAADVAVRIAEADLRMDPQAEEHAKGLAVTEGKTPFILSEAPLLRILLIRLPAGEDGAERNILVVTMHHIIGDGWSIGILMRELTRLYAGESPDALPPLPIRYRDYAAWHNRLIAGEVGKEARTYWRETLSGGIAPLELPTDFPRPDVVTGQGASVALEFGRELTLGVNRLAAQYGATLFMTLLAGITVLLHARSGQDDIVVGAPVAGREHPDLEPQIGFYLNTLALRTKIRSEENFGMLLGRVKKMVENSFAHQEYPFDLIVEELALPQDQGRNPLFDVLFVLQNNEPAGLLLAGARVSPYLEGALMSKFDLMFDLADGGNKGGGIGGNIEYSADLYRPETVAQFGADLVKLLEAAVADPSVTLAELDLLLSPPTVEAASDLFMQASTDLSEEF